MAIASAIINVDKRRSVLTEQSTDVAPTIVGVAYLRFMKNVKTNICVFIITTDTLAHGKSLFCRNQTLNFVECHPRKTTKCRILVLCVMRTCDSGDGMNDLSALHKKHCSHIAC